MIDDLKYHLFTILVGIITSTVITFLFFNGGIIQALLSAVLVVVLYVIIQVVIHREGVKK